MCTKIMKMDFLKRTIFLVAINGSCVAKSKNVLKTRISGGSETTSGDNTFVVLITTSFTQGSQTGHGKSTGSIVSETAVLTCAHCVAATNRVYNLQETYILVGANSNDDPNALKVNPSRIIAHPNYASQPNFADLALVRSAASLLSNGLGSVVALGNLDSFTNKRATLSVKIIGWGLGSFTADEFAPTKLKYGLMNAISCGPKANEVQKLCLTSNKIQTRFGDSGGPVINTANNLLIGVIQKNQKIPPGAQDTDDFLRRGEAIGVPYYYDWIVNNMN